MENVSRHWPDFQFTNGEIHDLDIEHYENQCKGALNRYALRVALMHSKW
jgi:hypothetical protein